MNCKKELIAVATIAVAMACDAGEGVPTVVNIVNFVRGNEPRYPDIDLVEPLREEVALNTKYHLPNTILLQYDALLREDLVQTAKGAEQGKTEYGVWLEMCRPLVEKVGIAWRGRPGWDWEWYVNPGLPMGYEPTERERICDEVFRLFKDTFGHYPKSVGGWLLDAHTMDYLTRRYGVDAFCICREQDATDAYGLRGGYANGAYYPSRKNALSAAVDMANAIPTPVFRMLTPDPIYNYGPGWNEHGSIVSPFPEACTLEPGCDMGQRPAIVDWFFRIYTGPARLGFSYMQTGQENCFGWAGISKGLPYQAKVVSELSAKGVVEVLTLGETGRRFKSKHAENIPQTLVALEDWSDKGYRSIWYSSKHYRMNLFFDGKHVYFRDIHKFCDDHRETYLEKPCNKWNCNYVTPPVVDGYLLAKDGESGMANFGGAFLGFDAVSIDDKTLRVTATRADGTRLVIDFREDAIDMDFGLTSEAAFRTAALKFRGGGPFFETLDFPPGKIVMTFDGVTYSVSYQGDLKPSQKGWTIHPIRGKARLTFGVRPAAVAAAEPTRHVFVGDSITHDGRYLGFVQLAETLANPDNRAAYLNLGICGDTTASALARWQKVVDARPTDITVMLGMNDTGASCYCPNPNREMLEKRTAALAAYACNLREIVRRAKRLAPSVRLMTPSPYDEYGNWQTGGPRHVGADTVGIASCAKSVRAISRQEVVPYVEVHEPFATAIRNSPDLRLGGADRIHPSDGGHLVMAACVVRSRRGRNSGQDARAGGSVAPTVWNASRGPALDYRPSRLGFPRVAGMDELDKATDLGAVLGREILVVTNITAGTYQLLADGRPFGVFTDVDLCSGIDLQKFDTPSARQSKAAAELAKRYAQIQSDLQYVALVDGMIAKYGSAAAWCLATKSNATNVAWSRHHAKHKPLEKQLWAECEAIPAKLSAACRPVAYRLELQLCQETVICAVGEPLSAAVARARATGARRIVVEDGVHPARDTTFLDGRDDCLEIVAAPGAKPVFDGGIALSNPRRTSDGLLEFDLAAEGFEDAHESFRAYGTGVRMVGGQRFTDLYRNGRRLHPAVEPNEGYGLTTERIGEAHESSFRGTIDVTALVGATDLVAHGYWHWGWADQTLPVSVEALTPPSATLSPEPVLRLAMAPTNFIVQAEIYTNQPYRLMGSKRFLDTENEWYFDRKAGKAYVLSCKDGESFVLSANGGPLVAVNGTRRLRMSGLAFRHGRADGLVVSNAVGFVFEGNLVERFGSWGLRGTGLTDARIAHNVWRSFGAGGVTMCGGDAVRLVSGNNVFCDNDVSDTANRIRSGCHGCTTHGCGNEISHNWFHDMPMAGVRMDGNEIFVASNLFERVTTEADDWGAVETYGSPFFRGRIVHNVFRDIGPKGRCVVGSAGVRFDDQICGMLVWGNRFDNCSRGKFGAVQINGGRENVIENNRFSNCRRALSVSGWPKDDLWLPHWHPNTFSHMPMMDPFSPIWQAHYGDLSRLRDEPQMNVLRHNEMSNVEELTAELTIWKSTVVAEDNDGLVEPLPPESAIGIRSLGRQGARASR